MEQTSLFNTSSSVSGFRFDYMEVFNWGTFDKEVYRVNPQGNNSLLTGANASGKSTLIDGLLTLLVPMKRKRFYNQSSGVEKKGNRTEESYFYGYYGNQQLEGASSSTTLKLRDKSSYSVLLANFKNIDGRVVTLFQIRYISGEEVKSLFGISKQALTITGDFGDFKNDGVWRKRMEKRFNSVSTKKVIEFFDGPGNYQSKMLDLFGMRSEKALALFNQIVGVKVLDDLDSFIHNNMLEELPAEDKYRELKENFHFLMEAKISIEKVKEQIRQLEPINEYACQLKVIKSNIEELQADMDFGAYWFAKKIVTLCQYGISQCEDDISNLQENKKQLKLRHDELDEEKSNLVLSINTDEVGKRISEIEKEINSLEEKKNKRLYKAEEYKKTILRVGLDSELSIENFDYNKQKAKEERQRLQQMLDNEISEKKRSLQNENDEVEKGIKSRTSTVKYLQLHKNNISGRVAEIRDEILEYCSANEDEIPFVGELISIRDDQREWELAIERILHNFALRLIVPDKYYRKVNEYVNNHNLKGKIVYQHYTGFTSLKEMESRTVSDKLLLSKVVFKSNNRYVEWVEDVIYNRFNYTCVDTLDEFNHLSEMAVTKEGLLKSIKGKHEKDDREGSFNRANYVLGWNNKEKISLLLNEVRELHNRQKGILVRLREIESEKKRTEEQKECFNNIISLFTKFDDINWQPYAIQIQEKNTEKEKLESENDRVKILKEQLENVKSELKKNETNNEALVGLITRKTTEKEQLVSKLDVNTDAMNRFEDVDTSTFECRHPEFSNLNLEIIDSVRDRFQRGNQTAIEKEKEEKNKIINSVSSLINRFKNPPVEITDKYRDWRSDVSSLPEAEHIDLIGEYQNYYRKLEEDNLPSFEEKFNKYLQDAVTTHIQSFRQFFENWSDKITKTVKMLNSSLMDINFNNYPPTYIQLAATRKFDVDINDFNNMLNKAIPNLREISATIDGRKNHFINYIIPFIQRLENEDWRSKVMDVRSWFSYKAEEYYKEDNQRKKIYESMGQLSGGEKAQLTYTILGSAIAYQFGLTKSGLDSSFRFIAIDEAFKAQDEDRARYLIELCKQLNLQLLVVTPSDNIHIVENDISYVHYVERKDNRSILYNMPITEFKERREKSLMV